MKFPTIANSRGPHSSMVIVFALGCYGLAAARSLFLIVHDRTPPYDDIGYHFRTAEHFLADLSRLDLTHLANFFSHDGHYPPLYHFCAAVFMLFGGANFFVANLINQVFLFLTFALSYLIMTEILGLSRLATMSGLLFLAVAPGINAYTPLFVLEPALVAATSSVVATLYLDLKYQSRLSAFFLVISTIAGFLIKQAIAIYLLPVLIAQMIVPLNLCRSRYPLKVRYRYLLILVFVLIGITPWYLSHTLPWMTYITSINAYYERPEFGAVFFDDFGGLVDLILGRPLAVTLMIGVVILVLRRRFYLFPLLVWLFGPVLVFSAFHPPIARYLLPCIVPAILIVACAFDCIGYHRHVIKWPISIALILSLPVLVGSLMKQPPLQQFREEHLHFRLQQSGAINPIVLSESYRNFIDSIVAAVDEATTNDRNSLEIVFLVDSAIASASENELLDKIGQKTRITNIINILSYFHDRTLDGIPLDLTAQVDSADILIESNCPDRVSRLHDDDPLLTKKFLKPIIKAQELRRVSMSRIASYRLSDEDDCRLNAFAVTKRRR